MAPKEENTSISGCHTALAPKFNINTLPQQAIFQKQKYLCQNTIFGINVQFLECNKKVIFHDIPKLLGRLIKSHIDSFVFAAT